MEQVLNFYSQEKQKIAHMPVKKKLSYIWDYYKLWIITIACLVSLVCYIGYKANTVLSEHWCYIGFVGTNADVDTDSDFCKGYVKAGDYDLSEKLVEFNTQLYFDYSDNHASGNQYYEMFVAYIDSGVMDACTMDKDALASFGECGRLLDLNREECSSIKEKYGDKFIYAKPNDTDYSDELVPVGIDISDSELMTKYRIYDDNCALGISANATNIDAVEKFLDYIYQ